MATNINTFPTIIIIMLSYASMFDCINNDCVDELTQWLKQNGGDVSNSIEIRSNDIRIRGVYTLETLHSNDILASIPISLLFTLPDARKLLTTILPQNNKNAFSNLGSIDTLSLALFMEHQNEDSFWNSYLKCLPTVNQLKNELNMPLYWTENEINKYLQTSKVGIFIHRRTKSIHESYQEINTVLRNISYLKDVYDKFTMDNWIWALSIVWSRSFSVMIEHQKVKCLVPFGDFFNFNDNLNELIADPMTWNQSQFAHDLMKYDIKSYTSSDGENFIFKLKGNDIEFKRG
eukprot:498759_1